MKRLGIGFALAVTALCTVTCALLWPHARDAGRALAAQDDPAELADVRINSALRNDPQTDRAEHRSGAGSQRRRSRRQLCRTRAGAKHSLSEDLSQRVSDALAEQNSSSHFARNFATGLVTGNADDARACRARWPAISSCFGDIRDVVREGKHSPWARIPTGCAGTCTGLAVTVRPISRSAAWRRCAPVSRWSRTPAGRRLGEGLTEWAGRSAREVEYADAAKCGCIRLGGRGRARPSVRSGRLPRRKARAGQLPGRRARRREAGIRAAQDTLRIAENPKDVARAARLPNQRADPAILKLLGRGACCWPPCLRSDLWVFGALLALFGLLSSIKATTERLTNHGSCARKRGSCAGRWRWWPAGRWRCRAQAARFAATLPNAWNARCRVFTTAMLKSPISTKARRADPARARLRLDQERQLGYPSWVSELKKAAPRHRARQSRPWRFRKLYDPARITSRPCRRLPR